MPLVIDASWMSLVNRVLKLSSRALQHRHLQGIFFRRYFRILVVENKILRSFVYWDNYENDVDVSMDFLHLEQDFE